MPFIQNIAAMDVHTGNHKKVTGNSMLIQIMDNDVIEWPFPWDNIFKEIHQFKFLDVEEHMHVYDETMRISDEQAKELVNLLQKALANDMDVIVHCHVGVCRSGAVCEIGVMMGFEDTKKFRAPNLLVKKKMMQALGWGYWEMCEQRPDDYETDNL